jgi:ribosomal protein L7/L12
MVLHWIIPGLIGAVAIALIFKSWRDMARRRHEILPPAGQATMADVERLVRTGERLAAIRVYREIHHVGLAEAKKAIDDLYNAA